MRTEALLALSSVIRLALVVFGEFQDRYGPVPYTDIDYQVFTDAARFVSQGKSPYLRSTYRYSPLLAYLLLPNIWVHPVWGKLLFSAGDILAAYLITRILKRLGVTSQAAINTAVVAWLFNPYTATISTRGSCDVLVVVLVLHTLLCVLQGLAFSASLSYGLAVHLRIYPIIYAPSLVLFLAARSLQRHADRKADIRKEPRGPVRGIPWPRTYRQWEELWTHTALHTILFGGVAGTLFLTLMWGFNEVYGNEFVEEAFLHHVGRKDPRHNFSIYFYTIYLTYFAPPTHTNTAPLTTISSFTEPLAGLGLGSGQQLDPVSAAALQLGQWLNQLAEPAVLAFVPQLVLLLAVSCKLHAELPMCWLALTLVFVAFNKVCTAQYFVWWLCLLPLVLHNIPWPVPKGLVASAALWVITQLLWLGCAYLLEFQGLPVYLPLWLASILFLAANTYLLSQLLTHVQPHTSFLEYSVRPTPDDTHATTHTDTHTDATPGKADARSGGVPQQATRTSPGTRSRAEAVGGGDHHKSPGARSPRVTKTEALHKTMQQAVTGSPRGTKGDSTDHSTQQGIQQGIQQGAGGRDVTPAVRSPRGASHKPVKGPRGAVRDDVLVQAMSSVESESVLRQRRQPVRAAR